MKWKIATGVLIVLIIGGVLVSLYTVDRRNISKLAEQGDRANILFLGLDYVEGTSRSDTMMFASIGPESGDIKLISIPRDMYVKYPDGNFRRINVAYPRGEGELATDMVSKLLGVNVPFYVALDYQGFKEIIDSLGGVTLDVERRFEYEDLAAEPPLRIDIEPGRQKLNGEEALGYIRYRAGGSDLARIERQQKFLDALFEQGIQLGGWGRMKSLIDTANEYMETNLSLIDLYDLGKSVRGIDTDSLDTYTLPGRGARVDGKSVILPEIAGIRKIVAQEVLNKDLLTRDNVKVLVLNGEGSAWLAHNTSVKLEEMNFQVTGADNADRFDYEKSYIIDLEEKNRKRAKMLKEALSTLPLEATIKSGSEMQDSVNQIKNSGVNITEDTGLILILGEGSGKLVSS